MRSMEINKKIGILGYGQIGKAIHSFYEDPFVQDLDGGDFKDGLELDVLHVCIPCKNDMEFTGAVIAAVEKYAMNAIVFIHSTVPVGTTKFIADRTHKHIVHAPIRGVHPHLAEGIKTFPMFVGADDPGSGRVAAEHLEEIGISPIVLYKSKTSELLKLLDTTYYGLAIAYHAYAARLCEQEKVNFDMVMTEANRSYNEGYTTLGKSEVVRPVLFPPEGAIGGHCIIPNAEILLEQFGDDPILQAILRHK